MQDHIVHEGNAYRKFEGEEDKSHHGPAPNKLFSSGHNLRTLISAEGTDAANLRRAADFVEMNLSQMGKDERRTRIGYKDQVDGVFSFYVVEINVLFVDEKEGM